VFSQCDAETLPSPQKNQQIIAQTARRNPQWASPPFVPEAYQRVTRYRVKVFIATNRKRPPEATSEILLPTRRLSPALLMA